jgi:hypothetical protein
MLTVTFIGIVACKLAQRAPGSLQGIDQLQRKRRPAAQSGNIADLRTSILRAHSIGPGLRRDDVLSLAR